MVDMPRLLGTLVLLSATVAAAAVAEQPEALGDFISSLGLGPHVTKALADEELNLATLQSFSTKELNDCLSETTISIGAKFIMMRNLSSATARSATTVTSDVELTPHAEMRRLETSNPNSGSNTTRLKEWLLDGYDFTVPPDGAQVKIQYSVSHIEKLSTVDQTLSMVGWWRNYWVDSRLMWNAQEWGVDMVTLVADGDHKQVWLPDITVYDADHSAQSNQVTHAEVTAYASGDIFISIPTHQQIPCDMHLVIFPFDTQICEFTVGSWSYHGNLVDVKPRVVDDMPSAIDNSLFTAIEEFKVSKIEARYFETFYACCPEPYPVIKFAFTFVREPYPYLNGVVFPLVLITNAGFLAFAVNPDAGERISLGITVMLTTQAIFITAADGIPKNGQVTVMSELYLISFTFSTLTLVISIVNVSLYLVRASTGKYSVDNLLAVFSEVDKDANGLLDEDEITEAITRLGMRSSAYGKEASQTIAAAMKDKSELNFLDWYEIVEKLSISDGLASHHNHLISIIINYFARREHETRRRAARRRVAAVARKQEIARDLKRRSKLADNGTTTKTGPREKFLRALSRSSDHHEQEALPTLPSDVRVFVDIINDDDDGGVNSNEMPIDSAPEQGGKKTKRSERTSSMAFSTADMKQYLEEMRVKKDGAHAVMREAEMDDPSAKIGRDVAGVVDKFASILLPISYLIVCIVMLSGKNFSTGDVTDIKVVTSGEPF